MLQNFWISARFAHVCTVPKSICAEISAILQNLVKIFAEIFEYAILLELRGSPDSPNRSECSENSFSKEKSCKITQKKNSDREPRSGVMSFLDDVAIGSRLEKESHLHNDRRTRDRSRGVGRRRGAVRSATINFCMRIARRIHIGLIASRHRKTFR